MVEMLTNNWNLVQDYITKWATVLGQAKKRRELKLNWHFDTTI